MSNIYSVHLQIISWTSLNNSAQYDMNDELMNTEYEIQLSDLQRIDFNFWISSPAYVLSQ